MLPCTIRSFFLPFDYTFLERAVHTCLHFCSFYLFCIFILFAYFSIVSLYPKIWVPLWIKEGVLLLQRWREKGIQILQEKGECLHQWL